MGDLEATLLEFGYAPVGRLRKVGAMKLRYLPTGRVEWIRPKQFESRVRTGRLQRVNFRESRRGRDVGSGDVDNVLSSIGHFTDEPPAVKDLARQLYAEYQAKIQERQDVYAHSQMNHIGENNAKTYAMIACLKTFQFDRNHMSAFVVQHRGKPPMYRFINEDTIRDIQTMINSIFHGPANSRNGEDSQMPFQWERMQWQTLGFEFVEGRIRNPLDPPIVRGIRRGRFTGACFPWIHCGEGDYSRFGIFNHFDPENYRVSCLVKA
jgi:hypothetical protein